MEKLRKLRVKCRHVATVCAGLFLTSCSGVKLTNYKQSEDSDRSLMVWSGNFNTTSTTFVEDDRLVQQSGERKNRGRNEGRHLVVDQEIYQLPQSVSSKFWADIERSGIESWPANAMYIGTAATGLKYKNKAKKIDVTLPPPGYNPPRPQRRESEEPTRFEKVVQKMYELKAKGHLISKDGRP